MQPTVSVTIDKLSDDAPEIQQPAPKPCFMPPPPSPKPCFAPPDPCEIFKLAGASFGVGVIVGGMLVFAFSKTPVQEA